MPRDSLAALAARLAPAVLVVALVACGSTASSSDGGGSGAPVTTPGPVGSGLGALPGVEGFAYREEPGIVRGFVDGANESLGGDVDVEIGQAAIASRGDDRVSVIAFAFPGAADDVQAVDYMAQVIDGIEDGFQAPAERGLDGEGYVLTRDGQSIVVAPWGRTDHLVFLFFEGPTDATTDLASAILNAVD
jgi:hypothetical protein